MRILGIDPGIGRTGWGVIEVQNSEFRIQNFGCIETAKDFLLQERLQKLYQEITEIITTGKPEILAIEELFFNTNAKTALVVGQARGVVLLAKRNHIFRLPYIRHCR